MDETELNQWRYGIGVRIYRATKTWVWLGFIFKETLRSYNVGLNAETHIQVPVTFRGW